MNISEVQNNLILPEFLMEDTAEDIAKKDKDIKYVFTRCPLQDSDIPLIRVAQQWFKALKQENLTKLQALIDLGIVDLKRNRMSNFNSYVNGHNFCNRSVLYATNTQNINVLKLLFEAGFTPDYINHHNELDVERAWPHFVKQNPGPIHWPEVYKSLEIMQLFLQYGAKVNSYDGSNFPLTLVIYSHYPIKAVDLLLKHGADPMVKDKEGNNLISLLVKKHSQWGFSKEKLEVLLEKYISLGVDIHETNSYGETAFDLAKFQETKDFLKQWF